MNHDSPKFSNLENGILQVVNDDGTVESIPDPIYTAAEVDALLKFRNPAGGLAVTVSDSGGGVYVGTNALVDLFTPPYSAIISFAAGSPPTNIGAGTRVNINSTSPLLLKNFDGSDLLEDSLEAGKSYHIIRDVNGGDPDIYKVVGLGAVNAVETGVSPTTLTFDGNKRYIDPVGDKAWTLTDPDDAAHSGAGRVEIEIIKLVDDDDAVTLNASNNGAAMSHNGDVTEGAAKVYTFGQATYSYTTKYHLIKMIAYNGKLLSLTSEVSEIITAPTFTTIEDMPTAFIPIYFKRNTGIVDSSDVEWTDQQSGVVATSSGETKPTIDGDGVLVFNGTNQGVYWYSNLFGNLIGSLPNSGAYYTTVEVTSIASSNMVMAWSHSINADPRFQVFVNTSGFIAYNFRTTTTPSADTISGNGSVALSINTKYIYIARFKTENVSEVAGNYLDIKVYDTSGTLVDSIIDIDLSALDNQENTFNFFGVGMRNLAGSKTYYPQKRSNIVVESGDNYESGILAEIISDLP